MDPEYKAEGILMKAYAAEVLDVKYGRKRYNASGFSAISQNRENVIKYKPVELDRFLNNYFRNEAFKELDKLLQQEMVPAVAEKLAQDLQAWKEIINYISNPQDHGYT